MPELRRNKLTGEWVSISEERAKRPSSFKGIGLDGNEERCPFCKGNEFLTSPDIYISGNGRVRIVANRYPILTAESEYGFGIHDVVIDTDKHDEQLHDFSLEHMTEVLIAIKTRMLQLKEDKRIKYIQVFKNQGMLAGASQPHSHWQIAALPLIPLMQKNIYGNALHIYENTGKCFICSEIIKNNNCADIYENSRFKAYCDFASKFCYEIHIASKAHYMNFEMLDGLHLLDFADIFKRCLRALNMLHKGLAYNVCILNSFENTDNLRSLEECMHFYVQIIPRIGCLAGFEFSTLSYINSVPPEKAAEILKNLMI